MVFIKKLELRGFKSFGSKTVSITFDRGFTAITGPNGSGKSNIIDAIVFCLGQNSSKKLRVDRLTSLIYDGGPSVSRPQAIRVTVTFDNSTRSIPVDSDTVSVTRELRQTGESTYYLNGRHISRSSMSDILSLAMINPEGINLVPQGLVTRVSELNPDEKRELLEEIFGVAQFDEKKAEAMSELREADTRLQIALARIDEIKGRVDSLEGERNDQLRLRILEDEIRRLKAVMASKRLADIRKKMSEERRALEECRIGSADLQRELEELDRQIDAVEAERRSFLSNVIDDTSGRRVEIQFSIGRAESSIERLKRELSEAEELVKKIEGSLPHLKRLKDQRGREVEAAQVRIRELEEKVKQIEEKKSEDEKTLRDIERKIRRLQTLLSRRRGRQEALQERMARYSQRLSETEKSLEVFRSRAALTAERLQSLKNKSRCFSETLKELDERMKELEWLRRVEAERLSKVEADLSVLYDREARVQGEVANALSTLRRVSEALVRYEAQRAVAEKLAPDELGLERLEELSKAGAVDGFIDRFENIISYDHEFEKAVLAAGRRWMKAVVVSDIPAMLRLAEAAKRLRVSRFTAIPLSEVSGSRRITPPAIEGVISTLSDVIRVRKGMEGVVNFIFGDVVLVKSPRAGYLASLQGFRSVTVSGDLFESGSAAFETGYTSRLGAVLDMIRDEASLSAVKGAIQSLQRMISKRRSDLEKLRLGSRSLFKRRVERGIALERVKTELSSLKGFVKRYRGLKTSIDSRLTQHIRAMERCERKIRRLEAVKDSVKRRLERCEAEAAELNLNTLSEDIRRLEEERGAKGRSIEDLSRMLGEVEAELTRTRADLEHNLKPSYSHIEEQIRVSEGESASKKRFIEEGRVKLKGLQAELEELKSDEERLMAESKRARPILEGYEDRLDRLRRRREDLRRSINSLEKKIVSIEKSLEVLSESERNILGELSLYGFSGPVEVFDTAEALLEELNEEYQRLRGSVNLLAERSYSEVFTGYRNLSLRRNQLEVERDAIVRFIEEVEAEKKRVFMAGFEKIDRELRGVFTKLTGGAAWLELEDPDEVFSKGVFLMTQFPGKLPRESSSVSGGEKTVSALSFILAIQSVYPSPFYLFDEIDAHLDAVNTERLADMLQERARYAQIVAVTLKEAVLSRASLVYGLYMERGASQMVRYRPGVELVARSG